MQANKKEQVLTWFPPYTLRVSARAKRLSLSINPKGLALVLPSNMAESELWSFVSQKRRWIEKHWQPYAGLDCSFASEGVLQLHALQQTWRYRVNEQDHPRLLIQGEHDIDIALGKNPDAITIKNALLSWLCDMAYVRFLPLLQQLCSQTGLRFRDLRVGSQRGFWGSCNHEARITLNSKLLFMPESCVKYVMMHELCHTKHANHSSAFWRLVAKHMSDYKEQSALLKRAVEFLPGWLNE